MSIRAAGLILALGLIGPIAPSIAADDDRDRATMERFKAVLERSPRRGTALDRVYGFHVERGELDTLIRSYRDRAEKTPKDGDAWLLLGLLEAQRGRDAAAVAAFRSAEAARPGDALPSYYLGQSLVLVGQPDEAVEAFERAIARKPTRNDLLEVFQALGRVHQRARRDDQAMAAWSRLEAAFPDDPRVQEQIAATLAEEGKLEPALARYEGLAKSSRDPYRKIRFRLEAADLKAKLGRKRDALADYETTLAGLDPASWLDREVRRKIEDVFRRDDDEVGLAKYYEGRVAKIPDDLESMTRLARTLVAQGKSAEARGWIDKALKLAPSNRALRIALIDQLGRERKFADAATQYEALAKLEPNNPDMIRDWGRTLLRDPSKPEAGRKAAAVKVWRSLVDARPDDASTTAQVADFCRQAVLVDEALALYQKAIGLAPAAPQYREYLGEYYHQLKRPADALATWRGIADGPGRSASSLERLGEVLAGFGYKAEAIDAVDQAIRLDPGSYPIRLRQAGLLLDAKRFDDAEAQLAAAGPLADDDERRDELIGKRIALDEASGRLVARFNALKADTAGAKADDAATWRTLARYAEAAHRSVEATQAAEKAVALDGSSISGRTTLARLYETTGRFGEAADVARALANLDRRARAEHLTDVAKLEAKLGRKAEALDAAREVLAATPGNPDSLQTFADLCFQLGEPDQAIDALRRATRANDSEARAHANLAEALAREFRTEEAIEAYWKAFERSTDLDARLGHVGKLAELHLRRNQFDRLVARLERLQAEDGHRREGTFFLAQAYASLGDYGGARRQLETLLDADARDTALLKQLGKLAEDEGDLIAAVKYQQQLHEANPNRETERRLTELAVRAGEIDVAEAIWAKSLDADRDLAAVMTALVGLASAGRYEAVLATTNRLLRTDPANWEALYREGRTLAALGRHDEAATRFRAILDLRRDDDELSAQVKAIRKGYGRTAGSATAADGAGPEYRYRYASATAPMIAGLTSGVDASRINALYPRDYSQARIIALAYGLAQARRAGAEAEWLLNHRPAAGKLPADPRAARDAFYISEFFDDSKQVYEAARDLVRVAGHEPDADYLLLESLPSRTGALAPATVRLDDGPDRTPALPPDEVDLVRDALREGLRRRATALVGTYVYVNAAATELRRAGRLGEIDADYRTLMETATDHDSYSLAGWLASEVGDAAGLRKLATVFDRLPEGSRPGAANPIQNYFIYSPQARIVYSPEYYMGRAMKGMADAKRYGEILGLVDFELAAMESPPRLARKAKAAQAPPSSATVRNAFPVFTSNRTNVSQTIDYPVPTRHFDGNAILLLRGAYTILKRDDRAGDLVAHLRQVADGAAKGSVAERDARLALSAVLWWDAVREPAARELARAVELTPGDVDLAILTAEMRASLRQFDEALAAVDSIEAVDQDATRRRELLALRLAVQTGRADRARQAAERLFGLRLDSPSQLQLAAQMHQLGMHDLADAVLGRARRQVGQNATALVELMGQYRRQGNLDAASQIALDVLRRSSGQSLRAGIVEDAGQKQAIEVLAASGKLDEMIEKAEAQVKSSPGSLPLRQALAAYYRAAGRLDKLKETNEAILKLRPEDTSLRIQVATQLAQAGDLDAALGHYRAVFEHDPGVISAYSTAIFNTFYQANRLDELTGLVERIGLKSVNDPTLIQALVMTMLKDPKTADRGVDLLGKAVDARPAERLTLLNWVASAGPLWERPEAYEIAKRAIVPAEASTASNTWAGLGESIPIANHARDGKVIGLVNRLLDASTRLGKLDDLASAIEAGLVRQRGWLAGKALLAVVRLRQGRIEEGRPAIDELLADPATVPPYVALMTLGQETRATSGCEPLAIALYDRAFKSVSSASMASMFMKSSAPWNLALLRRNAGRPDQALVIARQTEETMRGLFGTANAINAALPAYRRANSLAGLGSLYLEIGDHADALRLADEFFGSPDEIDQARNHPITVGYPSVDSLIADAREVAGRALDGLTPEALPATLEALIKPADPARPVDLRLVVFPREVDRAEIRSLLAIALNLARRDPATLAKAKADLDAVLQARPVDLEARMAVALLAAPEAVGPAASALDRLADETPLPPPTPGGRADARARDEATRWLGLCLVARRCWEGDSTAGLGDKLAAKALDAARRLPDPGWATAMLRDLGRKTLDRGDRAGAEARYAAILALIEQDPLLLAPTPAPNRPTPAPKRATPAPTPGRGAPQPAPARARVPSYTLTRFRRAAEFATLAGEAGLADLSLKAIRDALKGGPPVVPFPLTTGPQLVTRLALGATVESPPDPAIATVEAKLVDLDALWTRAKVDPAAAYEALRDVVIPATRPTEVFPYDAELTRANRPSSADADARAGPVARLLARRARDAGRLDDLRARLAERQELPQAKDAIRRILAAIDEASRP